MNTKILARTVLSIGAVAMASVVFTATSANAYEVLFRDTFDRADSTVSDGTGLNESTDGKSGALGTLDWGGIPISWDTAANGGGVIDPSLSSVDIDGSALRIDSENFVGSSGGVAYVNHNFIDSAITTEGQFTVSLDITEHTTGTTSTDRFGAFALGLPLASIQNQDRSGDITGADFYMGFGETSGDNFIRIRENGAITDFPIIASLPDTLSTKFFVTDFNATTTVSYESFLDGDPLASGSFEWSGTNENYIKLQSNSTGPTRFDNFEVFVGEPPALGLEVNTLSGDITMLGHDTESFDINSYQVTSDLGQLDPSEGKWNSLDDQNFPATSGIAGDFNNDDLVNSVDLTDPVDGWETRFGADLDGSDFLDWQRNFGSSGTPTGWEEGGAVGTSFLGEIILVGDSTIAASASISLGTVYTGPAEGDLKFIYRTADGSLARGNVSYVGAVAAAAVPEPSSLALVAVGLLGLGTRRRKQGIYTLSADIINITQGNMAFGSGEDPTASVNGADLEPA